MQPLFTEAAGSLPSITAWIQDCLIALKSGSGMGWVGTFAFSTVLVRASLLPLVRLQVLESRKLAKATLELNFFGTVVEGEAEYNEWGYVVC